LALCQRYFEQIQKQGSAETLIATGFGYGNSYVFATYFYRVTKRAQPTVSLIGATSNLQCLNGGGNWGGATGFASGPNENTTRLQLNTTNISANNACEVRFEGNYPNAIQISAEL
jgi:hypothetical protein